MISASILFSVGVKWSFIINMLEAISNWQFVLNLSKRSDTCIWKWKTDIEIVVKHNYSIRQMQKKIEIPAGVSGGCSAIGS